MAAREEGEEAAREKRAGEVVAVVMVEGQFWQQTGGGAHSGARRTLHDLCRESKVEPVPSVVLTKGGEGASGVEGWVGRTTNRRVHTTTSP